MADDVLILVVTGGAAAGKPTTAARVNAILGWQQLSIDEELAQGGSWDTLCERVAHLTAPAVIESIAMPWRYRSELNLHRYRQLVVTCREDVRQARLRSRVYLERSPEDWRRCVDTTRGVPDAEIASIASWARG